MKKALAMNTLAMKTKPDKRTKKVGVTTPKRKGKVET